MKNNKGFTLVEMVCVIAIIVFIAGATFVAVSQYIQRSKEMSAQINEHGTLVDAQKGAVDNYLTTTRAKIESATTNTSQQAEGAPANGGNNGGDPGDNTGASESETSEELPPPPPSEEPTEPSYAGTGNPNGNTNAPGASVNVTNSWGGGAQIQWSTGGTNANYFVFYAPGATNFNSWTGNANVKIEGDYVILTLVNNATSSGAGGQFDGVSNANNIKLVYFEMK